MKRRETRRLASNFPMNTRQKSNQASPANHLNKLSPRQFLGATTIASAALSGMDRRLQRWQTARQPFRLGWPIGRSGLARQRRAALASARRNDPQAIALGSAKHEVHQFDRSQ